MTAPARVQRVHELKADPIPFEGVASGRKRCEVRQDDRGFAVGDWLHLREFDRSAQAYTGRAAWAAVTHIQTDYGLPDGLVVMSIDVLAQEHVGAQGGGNADQGREG